MVAPNRVGSVGEGLFPYAGRTARESDCDQLWCKGWVVLRCGLAVAEARVGVAALQPTSTKIVEHPHAHHGR